MPPSPPSPTVPPSPDSAAPSVEPLDVDGVTAIAVGTIAWAVLLVLALLLRTRLADAGADWWIGVALAGFLLGLLGLPYLLRRRASLRRAAGPTA